MKMYSPKSIIFSEGNTYRNPRATEGESIFLIFTQSLLNPPSTWHKSNRGIEQNIDGFYTETTQKGGFSKLCVKIKKICYTDLNIECFTGCKRIKQRHISFILYYEKFQLQLI
jgi:hypothetical protein